MQQPSLFLFIVRIEEYEFIGIKKNRILKSVPTIFLELSVVISKDMYMIERLLLLATLQTVTTNMGNSHSYYNNRQIIRYDRTTFWTIL